jgi:hypothetical protein
MHAMRIENFKRWQWALVGLALGLIISLWRGWVGAEGTLLGRTTLDSSEFERMLVGKSPTGMPLVKDIRYYGQEDGTDWVIAEQFMTRGRGQNKTESYIPVKVAAQRPYVPTLNPPAKANPNFTVVDYLQSVHAIDPHVKFSTRWWDQEPLRSPLFALMGMMLMAGACPAIFHLLGAAEATVDSAKSKEREYDLSRFGRGKPEASNSSRRGPTKQDLAHLRELECELERKLACSGDNSSDTIPGATPDSMSPTSAASPAQSIRKLDAGPLESQAEAKPKPAKDYGGEFYPTETHVKRDPT